VAAVAAAYGMRGLPEPPRAEVAGLAGHVRAVLGNRWALLVFAFAFVEGGVMLGTMAFLATALVHQGFTVAVAGLATMAYGLGALVLSRLVKRLARGWPAWWLIAVGGAQMVLAYAVVAVQVSLATVIVSALLLSGGWSFMHSSLQTWVTSVVPQARGTTVAFFAAALFVGSAVSSWAGGPAAGAGAYGTLFAVSAAIAVPLTIVATLSRRRYG
ncbi:MAG: MFS transporter, partial [Nonomuraea sp.]|nr:MFS transporter [Nonomuraea sp.]